jgi:hypothetical protein
MSGTQSQDGRLHLIAFSSLFYVVAPAAMVLRVRTVRHLAAVSFIAPISARVARRGWWQRQCRGHVRFAPAGIRVGCKQPKINQISHFSDRAQHRSAHRRQRFLGAAKLAQHISPWYLGRLVCQQE